MELELEVIWDGRGYLTVIPDIPRPAPPLRTDGEHRPDTSLDALRRWLSDGRWWTQQALAEASGYSRSSVQTALQRLSAGKHLEILHGQGHTVAQYRWRG